MGRSSGCWCIWIFSRKGFSQRRALLNSKKTYFLKEEQNIQWHYTNVLEVKNLSRCFVEKQRLL
jgi:hypothetical protein